MCLYASDPDDAAVVLTATKFSARERNDAPVHQRSRSRRRALQAVNTT
jgi:hypothetical protein